MYDLSPGITMRSTIPAYSYRHGLNFIPGIVKTRIDCYSGISNPSLIEVAVHSDHRNRGYSLFLLLVHPQPRPVQSRWLAPLCGMGFRCRKDCSPGFFLTHSTLVSKLFFLAVQGSGALLSSNLEGALYKSP